MSRTPDYSTIKPYAVIYHSNNLGYTELTDFSNLDGMFPSDKSKLAKKPGKPFKSKKVSPECQAILDQILLIKQATIKALANSDNNTVMQLNAKYMALINKYHQLCDSETQHSGKSHFSNVAGVGMTTTVLRDPVTGQLITEQSVASQSNKDEKESLYDWVSLGLTSASSIFGKKPATPTTGTNIYLGANTKPQGMSPVTIAGILLGVTALGVIGYYIFKK